MVVFSLSNDFELLVRQIILGVVGEEGIVQIWCYEVFKTTVLSLVFLHQSKID